MEIVREKDGCLTTVSECGEASVTLSADAMMMRVCFPMAVQDKIIKSKAPRLEYQYVKVS
jgi:hypothetical protein